MSNRHPPPSLLWGLYPPSVVGNIYHQRFFIKIQLALSLLQSSVHIIHYSFSAMFVLISSLIVSFTCSGSSGQAVMICSNSGQTWELCTRFCTLLELVFLLSPLLCELSEFKFESNPAHFGLAKFCRAFFVPSMLGTLKKAGSNYVGVPAL